MENLDRPQKVLNWFNGLTEGPIGLRSSGLYQCPVVTFTCIYLADTFFSKWLTQVACHVACNVFLNWYILFQKYCTIGIALHYITYFIPTFIQRDFVVSADAFIQSDLGGLQWRLNILSVCVFSANEPITLRCHRTLCECGVNVKKCIFSNII